MQGYDLADAILALSLRDRSVERVEALRELPTAASLAITNSPKSPMAMAADQHIRLANGSDATPSSSGYTATLLAAGLAVEALTKAEAAGAKMDRLADLFRDRRAIDYVGAGASLGTADGASLLIREAARIPASAYDTRHYLHGPMEAMDATTGVVLFGDGREVEITRELDRIGCLTLLVTSRDDIDDGAALTVIRVARVDNLILQALVDIFPAQLLAAELSDAAGLT